MEKLIEKYDGFLIDVWGVIHDGTHPFPKAISCLNHLIHCNKKVLFLSNIPRPGSLTYKKLLEYGVNVSPEMILTSGDIVRHQLIHFEDSNFKTIEKRGRRFYHLGAARNQDILMGLKVDPTENIKEAHFVLLTAYLDEDEDFNQHEAFYKESLNLNLPMICANPDKTILYSSKLRHCAGVLAEQYQKLGGTVYYYGKPHSAIYEVAIQKMKEFGIKKECVLMVGDTLDTDILGAKQAGIDSALVLTGNAGIELKNKFLGGRDSSSDISYEKNNSILMQYFSQANIFPTWVVPELICPL